MNLGISGCLDEAGCAVVLALEHNVQMISHLLETSSSLYSSSGFGFYCNSCTCMTIGHTLDVNAVFEKQISTIYLLSWNMLIIYVHIYYLFPCWFTWHASDYVPGMHCILLGIYTIISCEVSRLISPNFK